MNGKTPKDIEGSLAALARAERSARPAVSGQLRERVLADAAEVLAGRRSAPVQRPQRAGGGRLGVVGWLRGLDLWAGAAVAAVLLSLAVGLGVGYQAGDAVLAGAGFGDDFRVAQISEDDLLFLPEGVL